MKAEGVTMEAEWLASFRAFLNEMGYKPHYAARLSRTDKNLGWVRGNVVWRLQGQVVEGKRRRPNFWPFNFTGSGPAKRLQSACSEAVEIILSK